MNDVQQAIADLRAKGWTLAAIAEELGVAHSAVDKWQAGERYPENVKGVLLILAGMAKRKRVPKRRRRIPK